MTRTEEKRLRWQRVARWGQGARKGLNTFKRWKQKPASLKSSLQWQILYRNEEEVKTFSDEETKFVASRCPKIMAEQKGDDEGLWEHREVRAP